MRCTVANCSNSSRKAKKNGLKISFHSFPKDPKIRKVWVLKCKREGKWNPNSCHVCSEHFSPEDFKRDLQAELLGYRPTCRLYPQAVPNRNLPTFAKSGHPSVTKRKAKHGSERMAESGNSDERPKLEAEPQRYGSSDTDTASPPPEDAFPFNVDVKPDVDTLLSNETEQMRADRERIMKHPYECCRLCLERRDDLTDVCQGTELGLVIRQAIQDFLNFEVVRKGESPWQVCYSCMEKLSELQEFKDRCTETKILWDDCSKYIDESSSANNARSNAIQHSQSDDLSGGTVIPNEHGTKYVEKTVNEMIKVENEDDSVVDEDCEIYDISEVALGYDAVHQMEDFPSVMRTQHDGDSVEVDGGGCESHLNPMHNQKALVQQYTEPTSMWREDKENSIADQVKGMYELDDSKGSDGEPLVLILREDGAVELCTMSEIPLNMRAGIQKYSKMTEKLIKKRPREKGD